MKFKKTHKWNLKKPTNEIKKNHKWNKKNPQMK